MFEPKNEYINNDIAARARSYAREKSDEIKEFQIINPWIGIYHLHKDNKTVFASDNTEVDWTYWDVNEPNNVNADENCTHLYNERNEFSCSYKLIDDGYCDAVNNNEECKWDGGDCCGSNEKMSNFICNDESNTEECKWDGGDCCGVDVVLTECLACECLEPFRWNDDKCNETRRFICEKEGTG